MKIAYFLSAFLINMCISGEIKADPQISSHKKDTSVRSKVIKLAEPNTFFTGRKQEIETIAQSLFQDKKKVLVIEGISGIGKTQLAKKYAYSYLRKYDVIWWFDSEADMDIQIDNFLKEISLWKNRPYYRPTSPEDLVQKLRKELKELKASWLIIFDNIDDVSLINEYIPLKLNDIFAKHAIVTSKKMNKAFPSMTVHKFQRRESLDFLSKTLGDAKQAELNALAETLEDFPLALAQACSYIKMHPSIDIETYLQLFKENYSELWGSEKKLIENKKGDQLLNDHYNKTIFTAIKMNIDSIKTSDPFAYKILTFCSLLNHQHIPLSVLERWAYSKYGVSKIEFHEALSSLLNYFLLEEEKSQLAKQKSKLFNQHELVQLITLEMIDEDTKRTLLKESAESFLQELSATPGTLFEQFKGREYFYTHMEKLDSLATSLTYVDKNIVELQIAILYFTHLRKRDFDQASKLIQLLKNLIPKHKNISSLAQLWFYSVLVNDEMYEDLSKVQEYYDKALKYVEKIKDKETRQSYLIHLGVDYIHSLSNFGHLEKAVSLCNSLNEVVKTTNNGSQKVAFFDTSAIMRLRYGQYEQCLKDINAAFELMEKDKSLEQDVPWSKLIKAHCLLYLGKTKEAYEIIKECYAHLQDIFVTPENLVLVNAKLVKGACLVAFGKLKEAIQLVQDTLQSYEGTEGYENGALKGMGYRILGDAFESKGDLNKAQAEYIKAEKLYDKILQEKTLDELSRLYTRLAMLGAKQKDEMMVDKYLSLHITHFGLAHPRTFEIKHFLDEEWLSLP